MLLLGAIAIMEDRLARTRTELAEFLRTRRGALSPLDLGLPLTTRRRAPGLRREEVAAMAGVGVTWYTWLEQGRDINVSAHFLDKVAGVLNLDEVERRHLFLLAHKRPPVVRTRTSCRIPDIIRRLLDDLEQRPAYVFNLRWDVIAWNAAAQRVFGFDDQARDERNMMWMLFADDRLNSRISEWDSQAGLFVASFRRDFAQAPDDAAMANLVSRLETKSGLFRSLWRGHSVHGRCRGRRSFDVEGIGRVEFDHTTLVVSAEDHLRLALYAATDDDDAGAAIARTSG